MEKLYLREEFIKLGQALKAVNLVENGVDAKFVIQDGLVTVNGEVRKPAGAESSSPGMRLCSGERA